MIDGFEDVTADLTENELELVPLIVAGLKTKIGKENAITSKEIVKAMKRYDEKFTDARLRKIVNHIRITGLIANLLASSKGYWVETDRREVAKYVKSLGQRKRAIEAVIRSFQPQQISFYE